jgi:hypothetical protein
VPYLPEVAKLLKADRRREWRALKSEHSKPIAASKISFDSKFGPRLDEYQTAVDAVAKLFAQEKVNGPALQKVVKVAGPVRNVAETYRDQVKTKVPEPARKELTAFLESVIRDSESWISVEDLFGKRAAPPSAKSMKQVEVLVAELEQLGYEMRNLATNLPLFMNYLKKLPKEAKYALYGTPTTTRVPEAQFAKYLAGKCAQMADAAKKVGTVNSKLLPHVDALRTAGHDRGGQFNAAVFVDRSKQLAQSPELKGLQDRAKAFADLMGSDGFTAIALGFNDTSLAPSVRRPALLARSAVSAAAVSAKVDDLIRTARAAAG